MKMIHLALTFLFVVANSVFAIDYTASALATHMEITDKFGIVVCSAYATSADSAPVARDCPAGTYTEQLFDDAWNQLSRRQISIIEPTTVAPKIPMRLTPDQSENT